MNRPVVLLAAALSAAECLSFTAVDAGRAAPVYVPAEAEATTLLAADEWTNYVFKATGAAAEIRHGLDGVKAPAVVIGTFATLPSAPRAVRERLAAAKSSEASVTMEDGGVFWIVGKEELAEVYGTCRLLEDGLGVRWFKAWEPDDPGDYVPQAARIDLDGAPRVREPFFSDRRLDMTGSLGSVIPYRGVEWAVRVGMQAAPQGGTRLPSVKLLMGPDPRTVPGAGKVTERTLNYWRFYKPRVQIRTLAVGGGHTTFTEPIRPKEWYEKHPEYFALVDGKRWNGERHCISNPEAQHIVARHIIDTYNQTGGRGMYRFGLMDGVANVCECDACRALDDEGASRRPLNADITMRFCKVVDAIAGEVYAAWPNLERLNYTAYSIYGHELPPPGIKMDPRMGCAFAIHGRCYGHRLDDPNCPLNTDRFKWLKAWMKVFTHGYMREYGNCSNNYYCPYERICASDLKLYAKMGIPGWMEEMRFVDAGPWPRLTDPEKIRRWREKSPSNWQWLYVVSRLTWDPSLDVDAILDEIESKYYAEAYPAMKKYHALRRRLWEGASPCLGYPRADPRTPTVLNVEGSKEDLLALLDEADKLAREPLTKTRIARDRRWLTLYWIEPNEKFREKAGRAFRAPVAPEPPVLDGRGDDKVWSGAYWTSDFLANRDPAHPAPPKELVTRAAMLSDADNLYFLFVCKEPTPGRLVVKHGDGDEVYLDDSIELAVYPPADANTQFQVCVNAAGKVTCYEQPMSSKRYDLGVEAVAHVGDGEWSVEVKMPVKKMYPLVRGDIWQVMLMRSRMVQDELTPKRTGWSIDGGKINSPTSYRPMEIGKPFIENGSFERLDKAGRPVGWQLHGGTNAFVAAVGSGHVMRLVKGAGVHQCLLGEIGQANESRKIAYTFKASGKGRVHVSFFRYHDERDIKAPHGYRRSSFPADSAASFALGDKPATCSGEYTIRSGEWCAIYIRVDGKGMCDIDDVSVRPVR